MSSEIKTKTPEEINELLAVQIRSLQMVKSYIVTDFSKAIATTSASQETPLPLFEQRANSLIDLIAKTKNDKTNGIDAAIATGIDSKNSESDHNLYVVEQKAYEMLAKTRIGLFSAEETVEEDGKVRTTYFPKNGPHKMLAEKFQRAVEEFRRDFEEQIKTNEGIAKLLQDQYKTKILGDIIPALGAATGEYGVGNQETPREKKAKCIDTLMTQDLLFPQTINIQNMDIFGACTREHMCGKLGTNFSDISLYTKKAIEDSMAVSASIIEIIDKKLGKDIDIQYRQDIEKKIPLIARHIGSGGLAIVDGKFEINNEAFNKDDKSQEKRKKLVAALASFERPMVFKGISDKLGKKMKPPSTQAKIEARLEESINKAIVDKGYQPNDLSDKIVPLLAKSLKISPSKLGYSISGKELDRIVGEIDKLPSKKEIAAPAAQEEVSATTTKAETTVAGGLVGYDAVMNEFQRTLGSEKPTNGKLKPEKSATKSSVSKSIAKIRALVKSFLSVTKRSSGITPDPLDFSKPPVPTQLNQGTSPAKRGANELQREEEGALAIRAGLVAQRRRGVRKKAPELDTSSQA